MTEEQKEFARLGSREGFKLMREATLRHLFEIRQNMEPLRADSFKLWDMYLQGFDQALISIEHRIRSCKLKGE